MRETSLRPIHESLGARMVPFAGWTMPVQYTSVLDEAKLVRAKAGLFDLGHMGRVTIRGRDAEALLQRVQTNDVTAIPPGGIRYAMFLDDEGRTQDDILVYREPDDSSFFVVINAANAERDLGILRAAAAELGDVEVVDRTDELGMFAIQGPASQTIAQQLTDLDLAALKYYRWTRGEIAGIACGVSRTGYTGEDGFEVYVPQADTPALWQAFMAAGEPHGLRAAGLGARDILRLEAGMPLYGHELDETTTPLDAGLTFAVKYTHDFVGRAALERITAAGGPERRLVGLTTDQKRVPRQGYEVWAGDRRLGAICSGAQSPTLGTNIGTAYVPPDHAEPGTEVQFAIRDQRLPAVVVALPFYKRPR